MTDSGGLQEESTVLGIPCLTARPNTERPITVEQGTSTLVGSDAEQAASVSRLGARRNVQKGDLPRLVGRKGAERIAEMSGQR